MMKCSSSESFDGCGWFEAIVSNRARCKYSMVIWTFLAVDFLMRGTACQRFLFFFLSEYQLYFIFISSINCVISKIKKSYLLGK